MGLCVWVMLLDWGGAVEDLPGAASHKVTVVAAAGVVAV